MAEMAARPIVIYRMVSGRSRSEREAGHFARLFGVLESQSKKEKLPFMTQPG
jgi:hypothetical protein